MTGLFINYDDASAILSIIAKMASDPKLVNLAVTAQYYLDSGSEIALKAKEENNNTDKQQTT